jgi:glycosyltransferase involved in cell wall biosynthesis
MSSLDQSTVQYINNLPSVSIITITQFGRFASFEILYELVKRQTYSNIKEWVIVEGSHSETDAEKNEELIVNYIDSMQEAHPCIDYIYLPYTGQKLGELRNLGNDACKTDVIVCMDDDDYYPPTRISHAVEMLYSQYIDTSCLIGGSSDLYIFDFFLDKLYKYDANGAFGPYHSTNNCMAYKREYLVNNRHDPEVSQGEEPSFTKQFTNPMVQFHPLETIICISHSSNTFNKRNLCIGGSLGLYTYMKEVDGPITNYIPQDIYNKMKVAYYKSEIDGPFTIEELLQKNDKTVHFLEKYKKQDYNFRRKIKRLIKEN